MKYVEWDSQGKIIDNPLSQYSREQLFDFNYFNGGSRVGGYANLGYMDYPIHECTVEVVLKRKPESILEIGCARGYLLKRFEDRGIRCKGLEISRHCWLTRASDAVVNWDVCKTPWPVKDKEFDLCCRPDTLIHTDRGFKRIDLIEEGDKVLTHQGRFRPVTKVFRRAYKGKLIGLHPYSFGGFPVFVTPTHPVLAKKVKYREQRWASHRHLLPAEDFIEAKHLTKDDVLAFAFPTEIKDVEQIDLQTVPQPKIYAQFEQVVLARRTGVSLKKISDSLGVSFGKVRSWSDGKVPRKSWRIKDGRWFASCLDEKGLPVKTEVNDEFCRFVGYLLADGCTQKNRTMIVFSKDEESFARDVEKIVQNLWGLSCSIKETDATWRVTIHSVSLSRLIRHFITKKKALKKAVPEWMLYLPPEKQAQILKGLLRGDGSQGTRSDYRLATSSVPMVASIQRLCLRLGIIPSIGVVSEGGETKWMGKDRISTINCATSYRILVKDKEGGVFSDTFDKDSLIGNREFQFGWINKHTAFLPIRSLESEDFDGDVCNLEVDEDNSYTTSACTVHNCLSVAFLEHVPKEFLPAVAAEMERTCKRGLHGIDFGAKDDGFDQTHCTLHDYDWWRSKLPTWQEIVNKQVLEYEPDFPLRLLTDPEKRVKLNVGCGISLYHNGWLNVDADNSLTHFTEPFRYGFLNLDARKGFPYPTGTVELIHLSRFLEWLTYKEAGEVLRELRRVIKPDGLMRIGTTDCGKLGWNYSGESTTTLDCYDELSAAVKEAKTDAEKLWVLTKGDGQLSSWDVETLLSALKETGWEGKVQPFRVCDSKMMLAETIDQLACISFFCDARPLIGG